MNKVLIFAGGAGRRMNSRSKPKQLLEMHGKPILIYTLEHFQYHDDIDEIVVVCLIIIGRNGVVNDALLQIGG